jgi:AcrR family transcriptional regulator
VVPRQKTLILLFMITIHLVNDGSRDLAGYGDRLVLDVLAEPHRAELPPDSARLVTAERTLEADGRCTSKSTTVDLKAMVVYAVPVPTPEPVARRPRNALATRQAILDAAVAAFCRLGYDGAGVREIAADAGVTAMLVNRYFGSKEGLFEEVVEVVLGPPSVVAEQPEDLVRRTVESLVARSAPEAEFMDPFQLTLLSAHNPRAAEIVREAMLRHVVARLSRLLPGELAQERGEILLSLVMGVWMMRKVIATPGLVAIEPRTLQAYLEAMLNVIASEPAPRNRSRR